MKRLILFWIIAFLLIQPVFMGAGVGGDVGIHDDFPHARVVVTRVVDGDTFHISPPVNVGGEYRTVVRLADIDAPESGTQEGQQARNALANLLSQYGNIVYLDIDKKSGVDSLGRIIAVAYVRHNDTHLLNVNKWMVENGHAAVNDHADNDFDPSQWSLYVEYSRAKEKLPEIEKVTICESCSINNDTSWGVRMAVTPDRRYVGIAFSEGAPDYSVRVYILNSSGVVVKTHRIIGSKVWRGMLDIAANETGFLVAWTDTGYTRTVRFSYIPVTGDPTPPQFIQDSITYSYHPLVSYYHNGSIGYWVIAYGKQTTSNTRVNVTWYFAENLTFHSNWYVPLAPGGNNANYRVGLDVMSGIVVNKATNKFFITARNYTDNTQHDIIGIIGAPSTRSGIFVSTTNVDNSAGDQGPEPTLYTNYYSYFDLYPSLFTRSNGTHVLVVYNETSTSLAYAIINTQPSTPTVTRKTIINREVLTTFYPWIAPGNSSWLVVWNAVGWVNASIITKDGVEERLTIADYNASFAKATYDPGSGLFAIPYAVTDGTGYRNLYMVFYDESTGGLNPWILPVATQQGVHETPLHATVLSGSPNKIVVVALEGNNLVAYFISEDYPELLNPIPIPEPWLVAVAVSLVTLISVFLIIKKQF